MATVAFIGLGHMGNPMAANLVKAGQKVLGFDLLPENLETARGNGVDVTDSAETAVAEADVVITMLPAGKHVLTVYEAVAKKARKGALFIDSVHNRRPLGAKCSRDCSSEWAAFGRCTCFWRYWRRSSGYADVHGWWQR